jgi:glycosyltransferase involved in cell wall biosynthesis
MISIVIPTKNNGEDVLEQCLSSIEARDYPADGLGGNR